jgi:UDP:flavonoid glycosyltransferase YjiC (YdhE family)
MLFLQDMRIVVKGSVIYKICGGYKVKTFNLLRVFVLNRKNKKNVNMDSSLRLDKKPLVGFFPRFFGMGETYPLIKIAKRYSDLGGEVVFFSHGGEYEYLAKEQKFEIIKVEPMIRNPSKYLMQHKEKDLIEVIKEEALCFKKTGIKALVQTNVFFDCLLAPRVIEIPLISVISGPWILIYCTTGKDIPTYPDNSENYFTRLVPQSFKNRFFKWHSLVYKGPVTKKINKLAKKLSIDVHFKCKTDLILGDHTLICDDIEFLGVKPTREFPLENYVGPILPDDSHMAEERQLDFDIEKHLKRSGKHILLTMGSSLQWKELFLKILKILNETSYNVIATYTTILKEDELPDLNDNILLKKFIPNITLLNKRVDLAVIHGGRGTVYTAAYSGKPVIGIPLHSEQQYNLDCLCRCGSAIRLSKKFFEEKDLLNAIEKIFSNYETYLHNAQNLANKLPKPEGAERAAQRIVEILEQNNLAKQLLK